MTKTHHQNEEDGEQLLADGVEEEKKSPYTAFTRFLTTSRKISMFSSQKAPQVRRMNLSVWRIFISL